MGNVASEQRADGAMGPALRVTIVLEPAIAATVNAEQFVMPNAQVTIHAGTLAGFAANTPLLRRTDVLIAQVNPDNARDFEEFERFVQSHSGTLPVVAAVRDLTVAVTRRVLRSQAVDVLPLPFSADELHQAIETGRDTMAASRPAGRGRTGTVLTFLGALGGMGTTTMATQAGMIWAESANVCLIDLDVQFGNAALYLNLRPSLSVADLIDADERMDQEFLRSVAVRHSSGLNVISCPPDIMPLDALTPELVERLLDMAAQVWDVVLVDLPGAWINWSAAALSRSDIIMLVTELSVAGAHQARRQLEVIEANGLHDRVRIVLNRTNAPMFGKADFSATEAALRRKIDFPITNDYPAMTSAIDEGKPVGAIKLRSRIEKDIRTMVGELAAHMHADRMVAR